MAITESWFKQDLKKPVIPRYITGNFFSLDNVGNLVGVKVYDNGAEAALSGSVTGYCVLADGTTVPVAGTRSGNQAYILLPQSVLSIPGYIGIVLKLTDGNTITTLLSIIATVYQSRTDTVITPSQQVITDWSQQINTALQEVIDTAAIQTQKIEELENAISDNEGNVIHSQELKNEIEVISFNAIEKTRNLFDILGLPERSSVTNENGILRGTANSFHTGYNPSSTDGISDGITFANDVGYSVSFEAMCENDGSGNGLCFIAKYTDGTEGILVACDMSESSFTRHTANSLAGKTISKIGISYVNGGTSVWQVRNIQIEKGSLTTDYVPNESAIDVTAREALKSQNSVNAFTAFELMTTKDGITHFSKDGVIYANGTATATTYFDLYSGQTNGCGLSAGGKYYLESDLRNADADGGISIYSNNGTGNELIYNMLTGNNEITIPSDSKTLIVRHYIRNGTELSRQFHVSISEAPSNKYLATKYADFRFLRAWGTGDSTIIKFGDGTTLVIDFGLNEPQGTLQTSWSRAINELGITHIDYAIISHYHSDHCGMLDYGIPNLIDTDTIFFLPGGHDFTETELDALAWVDVQANDKIVQNYNMVKAVMAREGCKIVYPAEGDVWKIGGAEIQFWNADQAYIMDQFIAHTMYDYNNASLCCYVTFGNYRVCFGGDAGLPVMEHHKTSILQSQIFKSNHHGYGYDVVPIFLNSLMPEVDITMIGHAMAIDPNMLASSANHQWCEANNVPDIVTGINERTIALRVSGNGYNFTSSCRKFIAADEGITL